MNRTESNNSASSAATAKATEPGPRQDHQLQQPESLRHRARIKAEQSALSAQAARIAHDFNNLLTVIMGNGETILFALPSGHPLRSNAEEICKAAARGARLGESLSALAQLQEVPKPA